MKEKIIIEVAGGLVETVYAENPAGVEITLVDWDNIKAGDGEAVMLEADALSGMPDETAREVEKITTSVSFANPSSIGKPFYILARPNSDEEFDDIRYVYIVLEPKALEWLKGYAGVFSGASSHGMESASFSILPGAEVRCLNGDVVDHDFDAAEDHFLFLGDPLPEETIEQSAPEWRTENPSVRFAFDGTEFSFHIPYKHARGGVSTAFLSFERLEKLSHEKFRS